MSEEHIQEASAAISQVVSLSAYLHGIEYDVEKFRREIDRTVQTIKSKQARPAGVQR